MEREEATPALTTTTTESPRPTEAAEDPDSPPWSPKYPPFSSPHIHLEDSEDLKNMEHRSVHDPDEFRIPDSEGELSTDVSNPYRQVSWTDKAPAPTEPENGPGTDPDEEGHTSAFNLDESGQPQDSDPQQIEQ